MGKKYYVIYADPPWHYKLYSKKGEGRSAENHYHTMEIEDIRSLPVGNIAADDCILFLWVTFPCLLEGISVMESWGFTYKTCGFNWVKRKVGQLLSWTWFLDTFQLGNLYPRHKRQTKACVKGGAAGMRCKDYGTQQETG